MNITKDRIIKARELAEKLNIHPCIVETEIEAIQMTANDPNGRKWKVGDKYYYLNQLMVKRFTKK